MDALLKGANTIGQFGPFVVTFILGFITVILLYWYSSRKHSYWKDLGVPYLEPTPFFGSVLQNSKKLVHELEVERYKKLGRVYGHYEGNRALLSVADPDLLRNILVKDFPAFTSRRSALAKVDFLNFTPWMSLNRYLCNVATGEIITERMMNVLQGEDWKRVRTVVTPTFTTGKIKRMMSIFNDCSKTLVKNFRQAAEKGEHVDAKSIYGAFTMDIIASSAFSTKIDSHNDPNNEFVLHAKGAFARKRINWRALFLFLAPWVLKLFKISVFSNKSVNYFAEVTKQIIEERKKSGKMRNDFLQLLLDTAKELQAEGKLDVEENDITENYGNEENKEIFKGVTKKTLTFTELVAQCVIFFLAGYETTASTLSFTSYNLALNPDVQERLIKELDEALRENNGELTYEVVQSLKTLDNVISETLRLYPPATRLERVADEDYELGDTGINIPKGMLVTVPTYAMHMDPEHFPDPDKFNPDRFTAEERAKRHQYTYMPFGMGPRNCVGMRFALMEMKVCLVHVLSNFRIKKCSETKVPLDFHIGQGLLSPKEIKVEFEIRKDTVTAL